MRSNKMHRMCLFIISISCLSTVHAAVDFSFINGFYSINSQFSGTCSSSGAGAPALTVTGADVPCNLADGVSDMPTVNETGGIEELWTNDTKYFKFENPELRTYNIHCIADGSEYNCKFAIMAEVKVALADDGGLSCNMTFANDKLRLFRFPSKVEWLRNGDMVDGSASKELTAEDFENRRDGDVKFISFPLAQDRAAMPGRYECRFYQSSQSKTAPGPLSDEVIKESKPEGEEMTTSPVMEQYNDGDALNISCKFTGYPVPDITWYHNDEIIQQTSNITFYSEAGHTSSMLTINSVEDSEHRGTYMCKANNTLGSVSVELVLHVRDRLAPLWPFLGIVIQVIALAICIAVGERCRKSTLAKKQARMLDGASSTRT